MAFSVIRMRIWVATIYHGVGAYGQLWSHAVKWFRYKFHLMASHELLFDFRVETARRLKLENRRKFTIS